MEVSSDGDQGVFVEREAGRTAVRVRGTSIEDDSAEECAGWTVATRRGRPKEREPASTASQQQAKPATGKQTSGSHLTRAQFAEKINRSFARTARMPRMPADNEKVIIRPRGGLVIKEMEPLEFNKAMAAAAKVELNVFKIDTTYPNPGQNILVISTPCRTRALAYANVREISLRGRRYEVFAYRAAPDNTVKGTIYNISPTYTKADIKECIINKGNPTAIDAHRIGETKTVVVLFEGQRVPRHVNFAGYMMRCRLYRQHKEVCYTCGQVGHRKDVCPRPETKICFACGTANPPVDHEATCKPRCKLCGGPHASGTGNCSNKYKTPYIVRQWEREQRAAQKKAQASKSKVTFPGKGEFPRLSETQQERGRQRGGRNGSRSQSRGKSKERERSQSRGRDTWAQIAAARKRQATPSGAGSGRDADKMTRGEKGKNTPSSNANNEEIAELRNMVKQLLETVRKQGELLEQYKQAAEQQPAVAEIRSWQLGSASRPASLTPPRDGTAESLQPLSKKMRKRTVDAHTATEDESSMVDDTASVVSNAEEERRPEDDGINYGVRIHKQGKRIDKVSNQVRSLCERMKGMEKGFEGMQRDFADFRQFIKDQLSQVTQSVTKMNTKHGQST